MTRQQDVRRIISEATAALDEFAAQANHKAAQGKSLSYSDGVLMAVLPTVGVFLTNTRGEVDRLDDEQLDALRDIVEPIVEIRRLALESRMQQIRKAEEAARAREDGP